VVENKSDSFAHRKAEDKESYIFPTTDENELETPCSKTLYLYYRVFAPCYTKLHEVPGMAVQCKCDAKKKSEKCLSQ
jgi:hypothetical protein